MLAIRHGHADIVELLMDAGADVNAAVEGDGSALIDAARRGDLRTVDLLIRAGADVNQHVRGDDTPLIKPVIYPRCLI